MNDMRDDFEADSQGGLLNRIKESPRTVSALIIILIVAAAIYAFSGDEQTPGEADETTSPTIAAETSSPAPSGEPVAQASVSPAQTPAATMTVAPTPQVITREQLSAQSKTLPEASRTDTGYTETAQAGDGVTHLARRATTRWLADNDAGYTVTQEHRIYIEDYIKDHTGTKGLGLGEQKTISYDLLKEAVTAAGQLNAQQLQHLGHYTSALTT